MRTGEYKVKFNYTILRGFIDAFGLIMAVLLYQTTYAYYYQMAHPTMVLNNVYPDGLPAYMWICGGIVPFIALAALWDYTYITQSNLMGAMESWFSLQTVLDVIVGSLVVYFMYGRLKAIAKPADRKKGNVIKPKQSESDDEALTAKVKIVKDDNTIMRS